MQTIQIPHHGRHTDGTIYLPENRKDRLPVVIFSHGFNGRQTDFGHITQLLAEQGIASVCYNFCGGGNWDTSGFPTTQMSLLTEQEDLDAVLDMVRACEWADTERIYLFGASQGGMVSALMAEKRPEQIRALMLLYPAFCIADDWLARYPKTEDMPEETDLWGVKLGRAYREALEGFRIEERTGGYEKPVLIMHGTEDPVVSIDYSRDAAKRYPDVRLEIFPGEGHGFTPEGDGKVAQMALAFVQDQK